jgi:two-component system sensor histidine kinase/response regulator
MALRYPLLLSLFLWCQLGSAQKSDSLLIAQTNFKAFKVYLSLPDTTLKLAQKALALAEKKDLKYPQAFSYYIISKAYWAKGNYQLSTQYAFKALKIYENSTRIYHWGECLISLGRTFVELKNYTLANHYLNRAHALARSTNNEKLLAEVLREKSFFMVELKNYDSALIFANTGIALFQKFNDSLNTSVLYSRKARVLFEQGKFKESEPYTVKSLIIDSLVKNRRGLGVAYFQAAQVARSLGQTDKAIALLKHSLRVSNELNNLSNKIRISNLLSSIYIQKHQLDHAIKELELAGTYKDSLYNLDKISHVQEMETIYELSEKDQAILLLEGQNLLEKQKAKTSKFIMLASLFVTLLLIALSCLFWRLREYQRKVNKELAIKNQEIELQNEEIQSQSESLYEMNLLKSKLLSVISHDLRGPVNNLHSLLDMVSKKIMTPDEFVQLSEKLKSNVSVTQSTLENLLNWSLGQMEGIKTETTSFDINAVVEGTVRLLKEVAERKRISMTIESKMPISVKADTNQVQLILRNLINNAIKFSNRSSAIIISIYQEEFFCRVQIQDTGTGMTELEVAKILETSEYFSKVGTDLEKGTGLGLLLCKDFIKRNGGEFFITSKPNQGTAVSFTLPLSS